MPEPTNILGKVGKKVGEEVKTLKNQIDQVETDLSNINVNSVTGDLAVSGTLTANALEVAETKIVSKTTVEVADNIIELNKGADKSITAPSAGIAINRGFVAEVLATVDSFEIAGITGSPTYDVGTEGSQFSLGMASTASNASFGLTSNLTSYLGTIEGSTSATTPLASPTDGKYFVRQLSDQTMANEAFKAVEVWLFNSNNQWVSTLLIQAYTCDGAYNVTGTNGDWYEHSDAGSTGLMYSATGITRNAGSINMTWTQGGGGYTAGALTISDASDNGTSGTVPAWIIWDDGSGNTAEEVGYSFLDFSNGNITAPFIEYTSWSDVMTFIGGVTPSDSSLASLSPPSELPWVTAGNGTVKDDTYYMRSHTYTTPAGNGVNTFEIWWRDGNSSDDYSWKASLFYDSVAMGFSEFLDAPSPNPSGTPLIDYQYPSQNFVSVWFYWRDGNNSTGDWYPNGISFTEPQSGSGTSGTWSGVIVHADGTAGTPESTNDKAEFLWNNTATTFETKVGSDLARLETDGIDVPDGDGVKINTVPIGDYAEFETEFTTAFNA